jgi:hypothetical protein
VFVESESEEGMGFECLLVEKAWLNNSLLTRYILINESHSEGTCQSRFECYKITTLFKSNLTFCMFLTCSLKNQPFLRRVFESNLTYYVLYVFNLQFEKSVFLRRFTKRE